MNRTRCEEIIASFRERAKHYQGLQQGRELSLEELQGMKKEYLNFTKGLLQALNEQERETFDIQGIKKLFRNSGLNKEELSDDQLDELLESASDKYSPTIEAKGEVIEAEYQPEPASREQAGEKAPQYLDGLLQRLNGIEKTLQTYSARQGEAQERMASVLEQLGEGYKTLSESIRKQQNPTSAFLDTLIQYVSNVEVTAKVNFDKARK
ncbi:hypothetical protein HYU13_04305 [Candidatus Woesearchaeota archaeon]|nr:hypothetical protein [Candidatus Woesearchaeota archaeon]